MISYRDMTFCIAACTNRECPRQYTSDVRREAYEWWGDDNFPVSLSDFPDHFIKMAQLEREVGHAINKDKDGAVFLDELDPDRGNFTRDVPTDCGFTCEWKQESLM